MLPDDCDSRPVYRRLNQRNENELGQLKKLKEKFLREKKSINRKSQSANPTKLARKSIDQPVVVLDEDAYSEGEQVVQPEATEFEISAIQDLIKH